MCLMNTLINQVDRVTRTSRPSAVSPVPEGIFRRLVRGTPHNGLFREFARQHTRDAVPIITLNGTCRTVESVQVMALTRRKDMGRLASPAAATEDDG